jgi:hypothetical protein
VVIDKLTYVIDYFNYAFQNYHAGENRLGDMLDGAINDYVANNDMQGDEENAAQLFRNVLFGDPVLSVPAQQAASEYAKAACTALNPASYDAQDIPVYNTTPVTISASTDSPTVKWKLIDLNTNTTIDNSTLDYPPFEYISQEGSEALYLIRASTEAGVPSTNYAKENWLFYKIDSGGQQQSGVRVASIDMSLKSKGPNTNAVATVTIVDEIGAPVSKATVSGHWSGLTSETVSGNTRRNGKVKLSSSSVRNPSGTFTFCVDDVVLSGSTYNPGANVETCDSITVN